MEEVHADEHRALPEKKPKRTVKTPAQVTALEHFYNEHKYPTEAMKSELAESIGLTEKQVSGWFCHRRLKDKRPLNDEAGPHGKQERSSGVIQDRGSGLKQDSCGSTKQGDNNPKEVESKRYNTTDGLLPVEVRFDHESQHNSIMNMDDDDDDTSLGSSSRSMNNKDMDRLTSKYPNHNDVKGVMGRSGPSGYLKVKGQLENAAITAVKKQLGRSYREDGPPLGIEFEPLPPGAFEEPVNIPVNQSSYYVGDRTALDGSRTFQLPTVTKLYGRYSNLEDLDEPADLEIRHASKHHSNGQQYKSTPPCSKNSRHFISGKSLQTAAVVNDNSGLHFDSRINPHPSGPRKVDYSNHTIEPATFDFTHNKRAEFVDNGPSKMIHKATKRSIDEFTHQVYPRKEALLGLDFPPVTNNSKRSTLQMTSSILRSTTAAMSSSFSDDETAETTTTSSGD